MDVTSNGCIFINVDHCIKTFRRCDYIVKENYIAVALTNNKKKGQHLNFMS